MSVPPSFSLHDALYAELSYGEYPVRGEQIVLPSGFEVRPAQVAYGGMVSAEGLKQLARGIDSTGCFKA